MKLRLSTYFFITSFSFFFSPLAAQQAPWEITVVSPGSGTGCPGTNYTLLPDGTLWNGRWKYYVFVNGYAMIMRWENPTRWELLEGAGNLVAYNTSDTYYPPCWSYSPWTVVKCGITDIYGTGCTPAPLPVEIHYFRGKERHDGIQLEWKTASEVNNYGFHVQRSKDGVEWENLDFVNGQGSSTQSNTYTYVDDNPFSGLNYYRLRQEDYDGLKTHSDVISVSITNKPIEVFRVYPNPVSGNASSLYFEDIYGSANITLYNLQGQTIESYDTLLDSPGGRIKLDFLNVDKGIYYLVVKSGACSEVKKIIVN